MKLSFDPVKHGWHFPADSIANIMGVKRSNGLCGGMSLSAVNYFRYGIDIPAINEQEFDKSMNIKLKRTCTVANSVLNFILYSQFAVFESPQILKQKIALPFPDTKENHHGTSINIEFPKIKKALNDGCFVMLGLRSLKKNYKASHQVLVYGYDDKDYALYMYDSNNPNEEIIVVSNGHRLIFSNNKKYDSYYLLMILNPGVKSNLDAYDASKNLANNFSVKPPAALL